jgi:hypothetical protein
MSLKKPPVCWHCESRYNEGTKANNVYRGKPFHDKCLAIFLEHVKQMQEKDDEVPS